jgi:hypothetical protein
MRMQLVTKNSFVIRIPVFPFLPTLGIPENIVLPDSCSSEHPPTDAEAHASQPKLRYTRILFLALPLPRFNRLPDFSISYYSFDF